MGRGFCLNHRGTEAQRHRGLLGSRRDEGERRTRRFPGFTVEITEVFCLLRRLSSLVRRVVDG